MSASSSILSCDPAVSRRKKSAGGWRCRQALRRWRFRPEVPLLEDRTAPAGLIWYVDADAAPGGDGTDWSTAYADLQDALAVASFGDEIWVAEGTYHPDRGGGDRDDSFSLQDGVGVYGGFAGSETERWERDWVGHVTILSGDIGLPDVSTDNSHHGVFANGSSSETVLDGFTITHGFSESQAGGGMLNLEAAPILEHLIFVNNSATVGGGMFNFGSAPSLFDVTFELNTAGQGGGLANSFSSPTLDTCWFHWNGAGNNGGGMANSDFSSPTLYRVLFEENSAPLGGGMVNAGESSPTLDLVAFVGNSAPIGGGGGGGYGGGLLDSLAYSTLTNVLFLNNQADVAGGGMLVTDAGGTLLQHATFHGNTAGEAGGALVVAGGAEAIVANCIFWGDGIRRIPRS